jgi:hypothetical protein
LLEGHQGAVEFVLVELDDAAGVVVGVVVIGPEAYVVSGERGELGAGAEGLLVGAFGDGGEPEGDGVSAPLALGGILLLLEFV